MRHYLRRYATAYAIIQPLTIILALMIMRRFDVTVPMRGIFVGSVLISLLVALSVTIFKKTIGNGVANIILGWVTVFPVPFLVRIMFGTVLFRTSLVIYVFGLIYTVIYSFVVLYASLVNKKTKEDLNALLEHRENRKKDE
jgi:phosphotransferase system  glucose/maltose/N-acetylglucosamine-specific IIC component